jgi:hypothetical protein
MKARATSVLVVAVAVVAAAVAARGGEALFSHDGLVAPESGKWEFQASDAKDGMVYNPFEGAFPDKGGRLVSPPITLPQPAGEGGYYHLTFSAESAQRAFQGVDYYDAAGKLLPDNYDVVYPGKQAYDRTFFAMPETVSIRLFFQSGKPFKVADVKVEKADAAAAAAYGDAVYATVPPLAFKAPADAFAKLPKTRAAMHEGRPWRVVMLGDSNSQDLFHSQFHALVKREFPKSDLRVLVSVRGSTGVAYYADPGQFKAYVADQKPDLLIIGGATNFRCNKKPEEVAAWLDTVIRRAKDELGCEVLVCTPMVAMDSRAADKEKPDAPIPPAAWTRETDFWAKQTYFPEQMAKVAEANAVAFWDFTATAYGYLFASGKPHGWFSRDDYHNGERGKQIAGRIFLECFKTAK